jgi:Protein of unknown function (DUF3800)
MAENSNPQPAFSDYIVFVDESGDHHMGSVDADYPLFVLTFCIFDKRIYSRLALPQISEIKFDIFGHNLAVLHEHDIRKRKGAFAPLGKSVRDDLMQQLTNLIEQVPFSIVAVVVDKLTYMTKYAQQENLYHTAMAHGLASLDRRMQTADQGSLKTCLICEARGAKEDAALELAFRRICDGDNEQQKLYPFDIVVADKKTNSEGLQIADLIARPIGLSVLRPLQVNRAVDILKRKDFELISLPHKSEKAASSLTALAPTE